MTLVPCMSYYDWLFSALLRMYQVVDAICCDCKYWGCSLSAAVAGDAHVIVSVAILTYIIWTLCGCPPDKGGACVAIHMHLYIAAVATALLICFHVQCCRTLAATFTNVFGLCTSVR